MSSKLDSMCATYFKQTGKGAAGGLAVILVARFVFDPGECWSMDIFEHLLTVDTRCYTDGIKVRLDFSGKILELRIRGVIRVETLTLVQISLILGWD